MCSYNIGGRLSPLESIMNSTRIVDFLTASPIHYALTVSPTIYAFYIEQFWATSKSKTVNDVKQIHAIVDGKTVVISESSVRSDLHFNDEDGITCLSNDAIFVDLALIGATTTATSLEAEQESGNINKTRSTKTLNEPSPQGTGSEVNTSGSEEDSMEHQDDLTNFVPPTPHDSSLSGGHTPGSNEGRPNVHELMAICTQLSNRVLALEQSKTAPDLVIKKLQKKVKRLDKKKRARTLGMNLFKVGTSRRQSLDKKNVSKQGRNLKIRPMFEEGDINDDFDDMNDMVDESMENVEGDIVNVGGAVNTATTEVSAASASVTTAGVSISTVEPRTPPTTTTTAFEDDDLTISQTLIKMRKLAKRMHEEEMAKFEKRQSEITAAEEANKAAINQELDNIQAMIEADEQMASRLQSEEQKQFTIKEKSRMLVEMIADRKRFFVAQRTAEQRMVKDNGKNDDSSSKQAGSRKKRAGLKLKPKSPKKLKVMKEQESVDDEKLLFDFLIFKRCRHQTQNLISIILCSIIYRGMTTAAVILASIASLLSHPPPATAFSFGISGPKDWLRYQKKKAAKYLLAPIDASRNSLNSAYILITGSGTSPEKDLQEVQRLLISASRDCIPQERNSVVTFQSKTGVEVCTFKLVLKNAASLLDDKDPIKLEAEAKLGVLERSFSSLNSVANGTAPQLVPDRQKVADALMDTISSLNNFEQGIKDCLEI
nr:abelson tyrosine-protein kinase [Tanacetum cinerariifolium]